MPVAPEYLHLVYPPPFPALLYGRNSHDPKKKGRSVSDQLHDGRDLCARFGWPVLREFKDTGISASRHARKKRDDFEELIAAIEAGGARIVVAFEASRYYRDLEIYVRLRNACHANDVLLCYNGMIYDLSKREDRKATAQDALQAEDESEGIRDRILRTTRIHAQQGGAHGKIQFGYLRKYDPDSGDLIGQFPHLKHAEHVNASFRSIDSGNSLYSVLTRLKGEPSAVRLDGAPWTERNVKRMLLNPVYVGKRVHNGTLYDAAWDALLKKPDGEPDVALFRRVVKRLTDPDRGTQFDSRAAHLQTGITLCGECGDQAKMRAGKQRGRPLYDCADMHDTSISEALGNAYVEEAVLTWLSTPAARAALVPDEEEEEAEQSEAQSRLDTLKAQLGEARKLASTIGPDGALGLPVAALAAMERQLQPQIDEAQEAVNQVMGVSPLVRSLVMAPDPDIIWNGAPTTATGPEQPGLTLEQKRSVLRTIVTIRLYKAGKGVRTIKPGRIKLSFIGEPGFERKPLSAREAAERRAARAAEKAAGSGPLPVVGEPDLKDD
ncbi:MULTISPECIES: recombinase family protein [unclassified Streptomyces]|uniref:recombinase family protein n=1 Tax=unclassified Streptomyces TaxID=2593676 RepID=UPI00081E3B97|nr:MULTISPECIES: recombinase family protein [unclassified Streptomyces]MYZ37518.1 recombinase family protein [Streptomyces sp. SID4917]SCF91919.1 Site-specific DNA recombinase [Streptomyces sp. MnatMP-M17]